MIYLLLGLIKVIRKNDSADSEIFRKLLHNYSQIYF